LQYAKRVVKYAHIYIRRYAHKKLKTRTKQIRRKPKKTKRGKGGKKMKKKRENNHQKRGRRGRV